MKGSESGGHGGDLHGPDGNRPAILDDHLVDLGVAGEIQVGMDSAGCMDVRMSAVAAAASLDIQCKSLGKLSRGWEGGYISVDPLEPRIQVSYIKTPTSPWRHTTAQHHERFEGPAGRQPPGFPETRQLEGSRS